MTRDIFAAGFGLRGVPGEKGGKGETGDGADIAGEQIDAARVAAQAARDAAIAARVGAEAVGTTNDTVIAGRINTPGSATATALSASIAEAVPVVGGQVFAAKTPSIMSKIAPASDTPAGTDVGSIPGLALWLRADDLDVADGTAVPIFYDRSANLRHASTAPGCNPATLKTNQLNGHRVVRFNGTNQALRIGYAGEPGTVIVVAKHTNASGYATYCGAKGLDAGFQEAWYFRARRGDAYAEFCRSDRTADAISNAAPYFTAQHPNPTGVFGIHMATLEPGARDLALYGIGGGSAQRIHSTKQLGNIAGDMLIGAGYSYHAPGEFLAGDIAEVLIFSRALKPNELDYVGNYLATRYALAYTPVATGPRAPDAPLLFSTFSYDSPSQLHLVASADGFGVTHLNGGQPSFTNPTGGRLHDPTILRRGDWYYVAYTNGAGFTTSFGVCRSKDLRTFEWVGDFPVSGKNRVWAPEWFVDFDNTVHLLLSCSTDNGATFVFHETHPTDETFTAFSAAVALTHPAGQPIDAFIVRNGADYYLYYKAATYPARLKASALLGPYTVDQPETWGGWAPPVGSGYEGPSLVRHDGKWFMYADDGNLKVTTSTADVPQNGDWTQFVQVAKSSDCPRLNHGTAIHT